MLSLLLLPLSLLLTAPTALARRRHPHLARAANGTYTNPIGPTDDASYADPWIFQMNQKFYLLPTMPDGSVGIFESETLDDFHGKPAHTLWRHATSDVWAPELHQLDGQLYIYCSTQDGPNDSDHRLHVLKGTDPNDPTAPFEDMGVIGTPDANYAIDGTVLHNYHGHRYLIWSGKKSPDEDTVQYIYIAEMDTPTSVVGERVAIHSPYHADGSKIDWQWSPTSTAYGVNEGPEILRHGDKVFVVYSASGSWDETYCLAIMGLNTTKLNPLDPSAWWANNDFPVFKRSDKTVGTGHASFPKDAAGNRYIAYHAGDAGSWTGWGSRTVRVQAFSFNDDDSPNFGTPIASGQELPAAVGY